MIGLFVCFFPFDRDLGKVTCHCFFKWNYWLDVATRFFSLKWFQFYYRHQLKCITLICWASFMQNHPILIANQYEWWNRKSIFTPFLINEISLLSTNNYWIPLVLCKYSKLNDLSSICVKSEQCYERVLSLDQETLRWALNLQSMKDESPTCLLWIFLNFFLKRRFNSFRISLHVQINLWRLNRRLQLITNYCFWLFFTNSITVINFEKQFFSF